MSEWGAPRPAPRSSEGAAAQWGAPGDSPETAEGWSSTTRVEAGGSAQWGQPPQPGGGQPPLHAAPGASNGWGQPATGGWGTGAQVRPTSPHTHMNVPSRSPRKGPKHLSYTQCHTSNNGADSVSHRAAHRAAHRAVGVQQSQAARLLPNQPAVGVQQSQTARLLPNQVLAAGVAGAQQRWMEPGAPSCSGPVPTRPA